MLIWLLAGLALYGASMLVGTEHPAVQTVLYKLGHVTTLAWVGYWIARQALGRVYTRDRRAHFMDSPSDPIEHLARAVVIAGVIIAGSLGL